MLEKLLSFTHIKKQTNRKKLGQINIKKNYELFLDIFFAYLFALFFLLYSFFCIFVLFFYLLSILFYFYFFIIIQYSSKQIQRNILSLSKISNY